MMVSFNPARRMAPVPTPRFGSINSQDQDLVLSQDLVNVLKRVMANPEGLIGQNHGYRVIYDPAERCKPDPKQNVIQIETAGMATHFDLVLRVTDPAFSKTEHPRSYRFAKTRPALPLTHPDQGLKLVAYYHEPKDTSTRLQTTRPDLPLTHPLQNFKLIVDYSAPYQDTRRKVWSSPDYFQQEKAYIDSPKNTPVHQGPIPPNCLKELDTKLRTQYQLLDRKGEGMWYW